MAALVFLTSPDASPVAGDAAPAPSVTRRGPAATPPASTSSTSSTSSTNTIDGDSTFSGPVVQAGQVHGLHIHSVTVNAPAAGGSGAPEAATYVPPRQLPSVPPHFTGRDEDLETLSELLAERRPGAHLLAVISGSAGIGKTTLASAWLHSLQESAFPDGQLYVDLRGHSPEEAATPAEALSLLLRGLGTRSVPSDPEEQLALWRSLTSGRRLAMQLDNALTAAQVRPLIPAGTDGLVVVTSRHRLTGLGVDGFRVHVLEPLGPQAGYALLARIIGPRRAEREHEAAREVVGRCGGLPLAVCLASARLAARPRQPVRALAEALAHDTGPLDALHAEGVPAVRNALNASYAALGWETALLYRRLGVLPTQSFGVGLAAAACDMPYGVAEQRLDELVEASLLDETGPDTYRFHDLVRAHAAETARGSEPEEVHTTAVRRAADWYLAAASAAQRVLTPEQAVLPRTYRYEPAAPPSFTGRADAMSWLDVHRLNLMACVRDSATRSWHATAWQLVDAIWPLVLHLRNYSLWIEAHEIGLAAARADGLPAAVRQMLASGAIGLSAAGRTEDATVWYGEMLTAARAAGDVRDAGQALLGLGACCHERGERTAAEAHLRGAMADWRACGYERGVGLVQTLQGEIALASGEPEAAVELLGRAAACLESVADPHNVARARALRGRALVVAGEHERGFTELHAAHEVFAATGALHWRARTLEMLGESSIERGQLTSGHGYFTQAAALYATTNPADAERLRGRLSDAGDPNAGHSGNGNPDAENQDPEDPDAEDPDAEDPDAENGVGGATAPAGA
ncbi:AAA family ATPase [Streptomyces sp. NA04227]|nr:AAA family ATPase [Streptomyces sp. NA04227]